MGCKGDRLCIGRHLFSIARQNDDRAPFRRFISQACQTRSRSKRRQGYARQRQKLCRLTVANCDCAGLVEKQRVNIARSFNGAAGFGEDVEAHQSVHARNANGGQQSRDCCGNERHEQSDQYRHCKAAIGELGEGGKRANRDEKDQRQPSQKNRQRDLIRRFLPLRAFHKRNHPVKKALPGGGRHAHLDAVRDDARASSHRRPISPCLADDGCALACNRGFVDAGNTFDHFTIGWHQVTGFDEDDFANLKKICADQPPNFADPD